MAGTHTPLSYFIPGFTEEEMKTRKLKFMAGDYKFAPAEELLAVNGLWERASVLLQGCGPWGFTHAPVGGPYTPAHTDGTNCPVGHKSWEEEAVGESGRSRRGSDGYDQNTLCASMKFSTKICLTKNIFLKENGNGKHLGEENVGNLESVFSTNLMNI